MKITILTLFPEMFKGPFDLSIIRNAKEKNLIEINIVNIRDFGIGRHKIVDDKPYGGGIGMVLKVDVLENALNSVKDSTLSKDEEKIYLLDARGETFNQKKAQEFSKLKHLILICGHYEGVDERILNFIDGSISIGNYVLTGGEIPAMVVVDAVTRLKPGVLKDDATRLESFSEIFRNENSKLTLEHPQFTRPKEYKGLEVPEVLLSGNHEEIEKWRSTKRKKKN